MSITKQDFQNLEAGDALVDGRGMIWEVISNPYGKRTPKVQVRCPGHPPEEIRWQNIYGEGVEIMDEELGALRELNHPQATVLKKADRAV